MGLLQTSTGGGVLVSEVTKRTSKIFCPEDNVSLGTNRKKWLGRARSKNFFHTRSSQRETTATVASVLISPAIVDREEIDCREEIDLR